MTFIRLCLKTVYYSYARCPSGFRNSYLHAQLRSITTSCAEWPADSRWTVEFAHKVEAFWKEKTQSGFRECSPSPNTPRVPSTPPTGVKHYCDTTPACNNSELSPSVSCEQSNAETTITKHPAKTHRKHYVLAMFPYPSGSLHMGHVRVYTVSDVYLRFLHLNGEPAIHPIGWDSFGLPAENAAFQHGMDPKHWTETNIAHMRQQLMSMDFSFDWDKELITSDPKYYKWTQWLFLKLYEAGLVYRKEALVNWDPVDCTVLANQQIDAEGRSWRSGAIVEKKPLKQWFIKTSRFTKDLFEGLNGLDWSEVNNIQKSFIGIPDDYRFVFQLEGPCVNLLDDNNRSIEVSIKMPRNLLELRCIALPPSHAFSRKEFHADSSAYSTEELQVLNIVAVNPVTNARTPLVVWSSLFPESPVPQYEVIGVTEQQLAEANVRLDGIVVDAQLVSSFQNDPSAADAYALSEADRKGCNWYESSTRSIDWAVSRQRYWGTPIPVIHCPKCKVKPVPLPQLPVLLPDSAQISFKKNSVVSQSAGVSPLASAADWLQTKCPSCGGDAVRETDTLDTFFDSSWYFLRYLDVSNENTAFDPALVNQMFPVDFYVGGAEHAHAHLFFARFICHFLHNIGLLHAKEPFIRLFPVGEIAAKTYQIASSKEFIVPSRVTKTGGDELIDIETGQQVIETFVKMSKSKLNGVDPKDAIAALGIDVVRLLMVGADAPETRAIWDPEKSKPYIELMSQLMTMLTEFVQLNSPGAPKCPIESVEEMSHFKKAQGHVKVGYNYCVRRTTGAIRHAQIYSVAVERLLGFSVSMMRLVSAHGKGRVVQNSTQYERGLLSLLVMLYPFAPHMASELWSALRFGGVILKQPGLFDLEKEVWEQKWPTLDADALLELNVYVNCIHLASLPIDRETYERYNRDELLASALDNARVKQFLQNRSFLTPPVFSSVPDCSIDISGYVEYQPADDTFRRHGNTAKKLQGAAEKRNAKSHGGLASRHIS